MPLTFAKIEPKTVDEALGDGAYQLFQDFSDEYQEERERSENNLDSYKSLFAGAKSELLAADLKVANSIHEDYIAYLEAVTQGRATDDTKADRILPVGEAALKVLWVMNETLDTFRANGIQGLCVALMKCKLDEKAKKLKLSLTAYEKALAKAKSQKNEAWVQFTLDTAYTAVTLAFGPVGIVGSIVCGGALYILDNEIGADKTWYDNLGGNIEDLCGTLIDTVESIDELATKQVKNAKTTAEAFKAAGNPVAAAARNPAFKAAGAVGTVTGFYFNAKEVVTAEQNVVELEKLMSEVRRKHEEMMSEYRKTKATLENMSAKLKKFRKDNEAKGMQRARDLRGELDKEMKRTAYYPKIR